MKIGIIGANGQVGTDLCFLFRHEYNDCDPIPIVRNELSAALFRHHDFPYRVGDVSIDADARAVLKGLDVVVIAARVNPFTPELMTATQAKRTNAAIVTNAVKHAPQDAIPIFFSSIAAIDKDDIYMDETRHDGLYRQEKQYCEKTFSKACQGAGVKGYVLRLGDVLGPTLTFERILRSHLTGETTFVNVGKDQPSNVVHTVTIAEMIENCGSSAVNPGTYTLVNQPRWQWDDVFNHYAPAGLTVRYMGPPEGGDGGSFPTDLIATPNKLRELAKPSLFYLPESVSERIIHRYRRKAAASKIGSVQSKRIGSEGPYLDRPQFHYKPVGERLPALADTEMLLSERTIPSAYTNRAVET